jgi:hypothetical protein
MHYTTADEAKASICEAIEASGAAKAADYEIEAIFDETFTYRIDKYEQTVDSDEFWRIVERHAK